VLARVLDEALRQAAAQTRDFLRCVSVCYSYTQKRSKVYTTRPARPNRSDSAPHSTLHNPFCIHRPFYEQRLASCLRALAEPSSPAAVTGVAVQLAVQHAQAHGIGEQAHGA
jgi:hypothetical protein